MQYKITTQNPHFDGTRLGLEFKDGQAITGDEDVLGEAIDRGYSVEELTDEPEKVDAKPKSRAKKGAKGNASK